jgi:hypothetical protein
MNDAAARVRGFETERQGTLDGAVERDAARDQPLDAVGCRCGDSVGNVGIADAGCGS